MTTDRMLNRRDGTIGKNCDIDTKHNQGEAYKGPGHEPVKTSVSFRIACSENLNYFQFTYHNTYMDAPTVV